MKRLRRVTEAEVIAEFLKNEFYQEEFHEDREQFEDLVLEAQLADEDGQCPAPGPVVSPSRPHVARAARRTRSGGKWRSSRRTWSGFGCFPGRSGAGSPNGSFLLKDIVKRIKTKPFRGKTRDFIAKVQALSYYLRNHEDDSAVLLIGVDDQNSRSRYWKAIIA